MSITLHEIITLELSYILGLSEEIQNPTRYLWTISTNQDSHFPQKQTFKKQLVHYSQDQKCQQQIL